MKVNAFILKVNERERETERERERKRDVSYLLEIATLATLGKAEAMYQELHPDLLGIAETQTLGLSFTAFSQTISGELNWKWSSEDMNQVLYGMPAPI